MLKLKCAAIKEAKKKYGFISPCIDNGIPLSWNACFTIELGRLYFWFNTEDHSTHLIKKEFTRAN